MCFPFLEIILLGVVYIHWMHTLKNKIFNINSFFNGWSLENWIKEKLPLIIISKWEILHRV